MARNNIKKYASCPVCGKNLLKCRGQCVLEITCSRCHGIIEIISDGARVTVLEKESASIEKENAAEDQMTGNVSTLKMAVNY